MALNFTGAVTAYALMIENFKKTLTYIPVTKTLDNSTGDETLTEGTPTSITGIFFKRDNNQIQDKEGLFEDADATLMVLPAVTVTKNSIIKYDGEIFRIEKDPIKRLYDSTHVYNTAGLYKIGEY